MSIGPDHCGRNSSWLNAATGIVGGLLPLAVVKCAAHLLLLETHVGAGGIETQSGVEVRHYQRNYRLRILGDYGKFLLAPAVMIDRAIRPAYWDEEGCID